MQRIRAKKGLLAKVARDLGLTRAAVTKWVVVPAERLPEVEASTGIPRHLLRPDICFPPCPHQRGRRLPKAAGPPPFRRVALMPRNMAPRSQAGNSQQLAEMCITPERVCEQPSAAP